MRKGVDFTGVNVVFFCHDGEGKFIMGKRSKTTRDEQGKWDLGGGAIEFGEKVEDALRREIMEEYGTDVLEKEFLGVMDVHRTDSKGNKTHWIALCHKVLVDKSKVKNASPQDHDGIGWFTLENLPKPIHSQFDHFIKKFKKKLI
jgi:8-oxo-dGTP diphosphatase